LCGRLEAFSPPTIFRFLDAFPLGHIPAASHQALLQLKTIIHSFTSPLSSSTSLFE